ncbi:hypothetical protein LY76DRAFT_610264 [Colletotrichum caudatum]|nr:hypothetical protein LY76DRAFT_610264 [Colletotrichum caudatum]
MPSLYNRILLTVADNSPSLVLAPLELLDLSPPHPGLRYAGRAESALAGSPAKRLVQQTILEAGGRVRKRIAAQSQSDPAALRAVRATYVVGNMLLHDAARISFFTSLQPALGENGAVPLKLLETATTPGRLGQRAFIQGLEEVCRRRWEAAMLAMGSCSGAQRTLGERLEVFKDIIEGGTRDLENGMCGVEEIFWEAGDTCYWTMMSRRVEGGDESHGEESFRGFNGTGTSVVEAAEAALALTGYESAGAVLCMGGKNTVETVEVKLDETNGKARGVEPESEHDDKGC